MEPQTLDTIFSIFDDILSNFFEDLCFGKFETSQIYFQHFDVFAWSNGSSYIAEKIIKNFVFGKVSISITLKFNICDFDESCLVNILFKLFELAFGSKELSPSDM